MVIKYWDNELDESTLANVDKEMRGLSWSKKFERAGSCMLECNDASINPVLRNLYFKYSSPEFLQKLESVIGINGLLPDPYLVGAGYSQIKNYGDLKPHIDFNWNDKIKLFRAATFIIYLTTPESGGEIEFVDKEKIEVKRNRAILFSHSEKIKHMVHPVQGIRNAVRFFYYYSKRKTYSAMHKSLYLILLICGI